MLGVLHERGQRGFVQGNADARHAPHRQDRAQLLRQFRPGGKRFVQTLDRGAHFSSPSRAQRLNAFRRQLVACQNPGQIERFHGMLGGTLGCFDVGVEPLLVTSQQLLALRLFRAQLRLVDVQFGAALHVVGNGCGDVLHRPTFRDRPAVLAILPAEDAQPVAIPARVSVADGARSRSNSLAV